MARDFTRQGSECRCLTHRSVLALLKVTHPKLDTTHTTTSEKRTPELFNLNLTHALYLKVYRTHRVQRNKLNDIMRKQSQNSVQETCFQENLPPSQVNRMNKHCLQRNNYHRLKERKRIKRHSIKKWRGWNFVCILISTSNPKQAYLGQRRKFEYGLSDIK